MPKSSDSAQRKAAIPNWVKACAIFVFGGIASPFITEFANWFLGYVKPKKPDVLITGCAPLEVAKYVMHVIPSNDDKPVVLEFAYPMENYTELYIQNLLKRNLKNTRVIILVLGDQLHGDRPTLRTTLRTNSLMAAESIVTKIIANRIEIDIPIFRAEEIIQIEQFLDRPVDYLVEFESEEIAQRLTIRRGCHDFERPTEPETIVEFLDNINGDLCQVVDGEPDCIVNVAGGEMKFDVTKGVRYTIHESYIIQSKGEPLQPTMRFGRPETK